MARRRSSCSSQEASEEAQDSLDMQKLDLADDIRPAQRAAIITQQSDRTTARPHSRQRAYRYSGWSSFRRVSRRIRLARARKERGEARSPKVLPADSSNRPRSQVGVTDFEL
eukprot:TRINITY_DN2889_c0_g1_i1.p1 TRINITY_DN2889_c0_g1~~TRINITY_DN2889_c0_g1_i1.p1  ORF type:complete len:112 (-),score=0.78 TRINITY_DN2889_c0_g1_i1:376-711(-)